MGIFKAGKGNFAMSLLDSDKYEDKINHIEISHARTLKPEEPLAEAEYAILRAGLG